MKAKLSKITYYILLAVLSVCFIFAGSSLIVRANHAPYEPSSGAPTGTINYVSFGDSMTNGYGLSGYINNGFNVEVPQSYPVQFAKYLAEKYNKTVDLTQLAVAAQRTEDVRFALEFDLTNQDALELATSSGKYSGFQAKWASDNPDLIAESQALWDSIFTSGDFYTLEGQTNGRWVGSYVPGSSRTEKLAYSLNLVQTAVREADVISVSAGNADIGVFLLHKLQHVFTNGALGSSYAWVDYQNALNDAILGTNGKDKILELEAQLYEALEEKLTSYLNDALAEMSFGSVITNEKMDDIVGLFKYTFVNYMLNYRGMLERFVETNENVQNGESLEIVLVSMPNAYRGTNFVLPDGNVLNAGDLFAPVIEAVNYYNVAVPSLLQGLYPEKFENVKFIYSEQTEAALIAQEYKDVANANWAPDVNGLDGQTLRARFLRDYHQYNGGLLFNTFKGLFDSALNSYGFEIVPIYSSSNELGILNKYLANDSSLSVNEKLSCIVYLAFEDAVVKSSDADIDFVKSFTALGGDLNAIFSGLSTSLNTEITNTANYIQNYISNAILSEEEIAPGAGVGETLYALITTKLGGETDQAVILNYISNNIATLANDTACGNISTYIQEGVVGGFANLGTSLTTTLVNDDVISGLLNLFGISIIGDGLGGHPSAVGATTITETLIKNYDNNYTCLEAFADKTLIVGGIVAYITYENREQILQYAYNYLDEKGYVELVNNTVTEIKTQVETTIETVKVKVEEYSQLAKEELTKVIAEVKQTIAEVKPVIEQYATELKAELVELEAYVTELEAALNDTINVLVDKAEEVYATVELYSDDVFAVLSTLNDMFGDEVKFVTDKLTANLKYILAEIELKEFTDSLVSDFENAINNFMATAQQDVVAIDDLFVAFKNALEVFASDVKVAQDRIIADAKYQVEVLLAKADVIVNKTLKVVDLVKLHISAFTGPKAVIMGFVSNLRTHIVATYAIYQTIITKYLEVIELGAKLPEIIETVKNNSIAYAEDLANELKGYANNFMSSCKDAIIDFMSSDLVKDANDFVESIPSLIKDLQDRINAYAVKVTLKLQSLATTVINEIKANVTNFLLEVKAFVNEVAIQVDAQIKAFIENAKAFYDLATEYVENAKAVIEQTVAELQAVIEEYVQIAQEEITAIIATVKEKLDFVAPFIDKLDANVKAKFAKIQAYVAELETYVDNAFDKILNKSEDLYNLIYNVAEVLTSVVNQINVMFGDEIMCVVNTIGDGLTYFADLINLPEFIDYVVTDFKAEFSAFIETAKTDLPGAITNFVESYKAKIAFVVAEIKAAQEAVIAGVVNQINAIIDSVKATISKITATIDAIKADIVSVLDNANAALVKLVDSVKEQILAVQAVLEVVANKIIEVAEFVKTIPELIEKTINEALIVAENIKNAVIEQVNLFVNVCVEKYNEFMNSQLVADAKAFIDALPGLIEEAKAQIQAQLEIIIPQVKAELENLIAEIKINLEILVAEIQVKVEILVAEFAAQVEYQLSVFKAQVEYQLAVLKAELEAKVETLIAEAIACYELTKDNLATLIQEVIAIVNAYVERYYDSTSSEYHLDANSYYVALGDSSIVAAGSYPDLYAESLGLTEDHYKNLGHMGMRIDDIRYLLDSSYEGDQYSENFASEDKDAWIADIAKADLVTISFSETSFLEYAALQMIFPTECNWNNFFGSKANAISSLISELLIDTIVEYSEFTEEISSLGVHMVESFLYSYVGYLLNIGPTIEAIKAINPEANVVLVGFSAVDNVAPQEAAPVTFAAAPTPSITTILSLLPEDAREVFMTVYNAMIGVANTANLAYSYVTDNSSFIDIGSAVTADEIVAALQESITVTGSIITPEPPIHPEHDCTAGSTWVTNATHHWKECSDPTCTKGTRFFEEEHDYDQKIVDVPPQPGVPGEGHDECICGKHSPQGSYTIDPLPEGEDPINPPKKAEKNDLLWLWITLPSVILVGAGIGLFFFIRKKFAVKKEG